jgi:hypothetical protein
MMVRSPTWSQDMNKGCGIYGRVDRFGLSSPFAETKDNCKQNNRVEYPVYDRSNHQETPASAAFLIPQGKNKGEHDPGDP